MLTPLSLIYEQVMSVRNSWYDKGTLKSYKVNKPVVSVGNLTMGGTGKTPLVDFIVKYYRAKSLKVGVVSRGYKGKYSGVQKVDLTLPEPAKLFGDEPVQLVKQNPGISFYVGRGRVEACLKLINDESPDVIIADDAFQHRQLKRDLDIVVLDASVHMDEYRLVPRGRAREGWESLRRAQLVILSKANLAEEGMVERLKEKIHQGGFRGPIVPFAYEYKSCYNLQTGNVAPHDFVKSREVLLVSGIGKPVGFEKLVRNEMGAKILDHLFYSDHYCYQSVDMQKIERYQKKLGAQFVLTTEKDAVKLKSLGQMHDIWVVTLGLKPLSQVDLLYESLDSLYS